MTKIKLIPVASSNIEAIGYDPRTRVLVVQFKGSLYNYSDVPPDVWESFQAASSKGKYLFQFIRGNRAYTCTKVD